MTGFVLRTPLPLLLVSGLTLLPASLLANEPSNPPYKQPEKPVVAASRPASAASVTSPQQPLAWMRQQLDNLPDSLAARQQRDAQIAAAEATQQPLYNPQLSGSYEQEGNSENLQLGVSQTIDWWDQRGALSRQAQWQRQQAEQQYQLERQRMLSQALQALVNWHSSQRRYQLARQQEQQLDQLASLTEQRLNTGDLGQIDVELTRLSLASTLADTAEAIAAYQTAENDVRRWLPDWRPAVFSPDETFWQTLLRPLTQAQQPATQQQLQQLPQLQLAKARWQQALARADSQQRGNRARPSLGVSAGRNADQEVIGLNLSIPLNLRNNYQASNRAAQQQALAAESGYLAQLRQLDYQLESARSLAQQYQQQLQRWQTLMHNSQDNSATLLQRQWQSGDLSTQQYLLALSQRRDGIEAGLRLQRDTRLALIRWLETSARLQHLP